MDPDRTRKITATLVALPLFIIGVGLILGLSGWWIVVMAIIIPTIIIVIWLKPSIFRPVQLQPGQTPPTDWKTKIFGSGGSLRKIAIVAVIIMAIWYVFYTPNQRYAFDSTDSLKDWECSGRCEIVTNAETSYLSLTGTMTLKSSSEMMPRSIVITPILVMPGEVWIDVGTVSAKYYTEKRARQGLFSTEYQYIPHGELYRNNATDYTASTSMALDIGSPLPIELKTLWYKEIFNGRIDIVSILWNSPELLVGGTLIAWGPGVPKPAMQGPVSIRSIGGQTVNIEKVEIY